MSQRTCVLLQLGWPDLHDGAFDAYVQVRRLLGLSDKGEAASVVDRFLVGGQGV